MAYYRYETEFQMEDGTMLNVEVFEREWPATYDEPAESDFMAGEILLNKEVVSLEDLTKEQLDQVSYMVESPAFNNGIRQRYERT